MLFPYIRTSFRKPIQQVYATTVLDKLTFVLRTYAIMENNGKYVYRVF